MFKDRLAGETPISLNVLNVPPSGTEEIFDGANHSVGMSLRMRLHGNNGGDHGMSCADCDASAIKEFCFFSSPG